MKNQATKIVTPFDWQRFTAVTAQRPSTPARKPGASRPKKALTVRERIEKIMAQRWGNPYCKPGAV
jgi:hypothetical protein